MKKQIIKSQVFSSLIYRAKRGHIYDPYQPKFNCYRPAKTNAYNMFDAWVCDARGNVHPGYCVSPVPILRSHLGKIVNEYCNET